MAKTVIVTGSSRGIGAATVRLAAQRGWDVCINFHHAEERANALAEEVRKLGRQALVVQADVSSEAGIKTLFAATDREFGAPDAVVCNAGVPGKGGRLAELEADTLRDVMNTNVVGAILTAREAVLRMSTKLGGRGGSIIMMSSVASFIGGAGELLAYAASKGAINTFTLGLSREVAGEGIRVNAVSPGIIDTEIHSALGNGDRVARLAPSLPMQRIGKADEVAEAILFFMSGEAAYSIGAILPITGGR